MKSFLVTFIAVATIPFGGFLNASAQANPNVVFIIVDDLNDMPYQPDGKPLVPTPNIDRLKAQGVTFANAHTNDPLCAPSRASMNFGLYPQTTSLYWFEDWRNNGILKESVSLQDNLRNGGYSVYGTGKVYHGNQQGLFDEYGHSGNIGPWPWDGRKETLQGYLPHPYQKFLLEGEDSDIDYQWEHVFGPLSIIPDWPADEAGKVPGYKGWMLNGEPWRYISEEDRDPISDELGAKWSGEIINRDHSKPFALFAGLIRTHTPLYAPKKYFDRFPLESIELPKVDPNDLDDLAGALGNEELYGFRRFKMLARHEDKDLLRKWLQAYMACVSFVDDQVGTILDALDASSVKDNTIVIFTSDHGFHVGEKNFLYKGSLWDPSTRIPLIVAGVPEAPEGVVCGEAVALIDIYPTLNELCGLSRDPNAKGNGYALEGHSMVPFIRKPMNGVWTGPEFAITALPGKDHMLHKVYEGSLYPHFSIRGKRWRYSLASDGGEELYDHDADPLEWRNLANHPEFASIKAELKETLTGLRDGDRWQRLDRLDSWQSDGGKKSVKRVLDEIRVSSLKALVLSTKASFEDFEFEGEMKVRPEGRAYIAYRGKGDSVAIPKLKSNESEYSNFSHGEWNRYRIRVHGNRHQVWINNRVVSDVLKDADSDGGSIRIDYSGVNNGGLSLRNARIRSL
jgi:arylsulfatase A-like enzyme